MPANGDNEIGNLLEQIFVFEPEFRAQILDKVKAGLAPERLAKLKNILADTIKWQTGVLARKIKQDKDFLRRFSAQKKKIDHALISERAQTLKDNDFKKMQTILLKIKSI
ncbi:MAG: hypothetical protein WC526_03490 [Patescibacteria group bacterium]